MATRILWGVSVGTNANALFVNLDWFLGIKCAKKLKILTLNEALVGETVVDCSAGYKVCNYAFLECHLILFYNCDVKYI